MEDKILEGAKGLFMKYGIKSVSMDDISRHLGMSKKTLYQFLENKEDLIHKALHCHLEEELNEVNAIGKDCKNAIDEMFRIARMASKKLREINPATMYDLQKYYPSVWRKFRSQHEQYMYATIKKNIEQGIADGLYRSCMNADIIARIYIGKIFLLVGDELFPASQYKKEDVLREFIIYHVHGIASPKGLALLQKYLKEKEL